VACAGGAEPVLTTVQDGAGHDVPGSADS
jgi:hypothetical protein